MDSAFLFHSTTFLNKGDRVPMATVLVPTPLRRLTGGQGKLTVEGSTIGALIQSIDQQYPGISAKILDDEGNIKRFINVFVNESEIRTLQGLATPLQAHDQVSIVPAMAGGQLIANQNKG
jgi:sulfur-carrier protein